VALAYRPGPSQLPLVDRRRTCAASRLGVGPASPCMAVTPSIPSIARSSSTNGPNSAPSRFSGCRVGAKIDDLSGRLGCRHNALR